VLSVRNVARVRILKIVRNFDHGRQRTYKGEKLLVGQFVKKFDTNSDTLKTVPDVVDWINMAQNRDQ